jgi:hypothetical protein
MKQHSEFVEYLINLFLKKTKEEEVSDDKNEDTKKTKRK